MKIVAKEIECVVNFDKRSEFPEPIRFRYKDKSEQYHVVVIDKIKRIERQRMAGIHSIVYSCITNNIVYELEYVLDTCKWCLFRV
jgi:hypothetical protein